MLRKLPCLFAALFVTGCQATGSEVGSGYLDLSRNVEAHFQRYLAHPGGEYFAVSLDGKDYGFSVCANGRFACTESGGTVALRSCRERSGGKTCKIYAMGEDIVWNSPKHSGVATKVSTEIGSGHLELSSTSEQRFKTYLKFANPEYFAVSQDGMFSGYSFCRRLNCVSPGLKELAVTGCVRESGGLPCYIYAEKRKVVWKLPSGAVPRNIAAKEIQTQGWKKRPIAIQWDGFSELLAGDVYYRRNSKTGKFNIVLPDNRGQCAGTYSWAESNSGVWSMACTEGMSAAGTIADNGAGRGAAGTGADDKGRAVRFTVGGSGG